MRVADRAMEKACSAANAGDAKLSATADSFLRQDMSDEPAELSAVGCASAHRTEDGVLKHTLQAPARRRSVGKTIALIAAEVLLVVVIIGLLVVTWLPAIIGANPDAPSGP